MAAGNQAGIENGDRVSDATPEMLGMKYAAGAKAAAAKAIRDLVKAILRS